VIAMTGTALAGAVNGPAIKKESVLPLATDVYKVTFKAGETAKVCIVGDGDTDLDLYVYDELGNLIASGTGPKDREVVEWTPRWPGEFTIKVVNRGTVRNDYVIGHN